MRVIVHPYLTPNVLRKFSDADIEKVTRAYHAWRGEDEAGAYEDVPGFCKAATQEEIKGHGYVLTPGRYVGAADTDEDDLPFAERFSVLREKLDAQFNRAGDLTVEIRKRLAGVVA